MAMPTAWQAGYDWANGMGPYARLDAFGAQEALGHNFMDKNWMQFADGADAALDEQEGG